MDAGSILVSLALAVMVAAYIARPIWLGSQEEKRSGDHELSALQAEHEEILTVLQELEMDHTIGKINDHDYQTLRQETLQRGAEVLRRLDALGAAPNAVQQPSSLLKQDASGLEAKLEQEIAKRRAGTAYCSQCGQAVFASDAFCSHCGASLGREEASA